MINCIFKNYGIFARYIEIYIIIKLHFNKKVKRFEIAFYYFNRIKKKIK